MRTRVASFVGWLASLSVYAVALPRIGLWGDRLLGVVWRLPMWIEPVAGAAIVAGASVEVWLLWRLLFPEDDCASSTVKAAGEQAGEAGRSGPLRCLPRRYLSRERVLGDWLLAVGLGFLLRSATLMALAAAIALSETLWLWCVPKPDQPAWRWWTVVDRLPGWAMAIMVVVATAAGFPAITHSDPAAHKIEPGILIQIRCKPGTADLWRQDFDRELRPAIEEAVAHGDGYTSFEFFQAALPGQGFDFALLYTGKTYAGLDQPRIFPQYLALLEREGSARTLTTVREMAGWEDQVTVSLVHVSRKR